MSVSTTLPHDHPAELGGSEVGVQCRLPSRMESRTNRTGGRSHRMNGVSTRSECCPPPLVNTRKELCNRGCSPTERLALHSYIDARNNSLRLMRTHQSFSSQLKATQFMQKYACAQIRRRPALRLFRAPTGELSRHCMPFFTPHHCSVQKIINQFRARSQNAAKSLIQNRARTKSQHFRLKHDRYQLIPETSQTSSNMHIQFSQRLPIGLAVKLWRQAENCSPPLPVRSSQPES